MILRTTDTVREGRVIDARDLSVDPEAVVTAVRTDGGGARDVVVEASAAGPVHERVGSLRSEMRLRTRTALALAGRSRGLTAPQDEQIERVEAELADLELPTIDTTAARRRAAASGDETARLRERVAELRGRIQERRASGGETDDLEAELADAARQLSEAETERVAASQRLEGTTATARTARDARERRLRLQDRKANLERAARAHLVDTLRAEYEAAVTAALRSRDTPDTEPPVDPFAVDDLTAALAVARVADLSAPVVLTCDRFATPTAAAEWLDAPVVRL